MIPPDREPAELHREQGQQQHPEPELRHRVGAHREGRDAVVGLRASSPGGGDPEQDPEHRREHRGYPDQRDRGARLPPDLVPTGWLVEYERPKFSWAVCPRYLTNCSPCEPSSPNCSVSSARWLCDSSLPRNRFATGSASTTRNRKKLKQTTKTRVDERPEDLLRDEAGGHSLSSALLRRERKNAPAPRASTAMTMIAMIPPLPPPSSSPPDARRHRLQLRVRRRGVREEHRPRPRRLLRSSR